MELTLCCHQRDISHTLLVAARQCIAAIKPSKAMPMMVLTWFEDHDNNNNILAKEIDSWGNFEYALREENSLLFNKMLSECKKNEDYIKAVSSKDKFFSDK
ncbi:MAG: hypothetical protein M3247_06630, partial [Thermoproteota archaeon]|nr:hypothetical protein [Thermoproteota archaeon]